MKLTDIIIRLAPVTFPLASSIGFFLGGGSPVFLIPPYLFDDGIVYALILPQFFLGAVICVRNYYKPVKVSPDSGLGNPSVNIFIAWCTLLLLWGIYLGTGVATL
ncbi:MAG: hypothetical protein MPJ24_04210 [Pirellulaceae bacterium]|nr:hypothetical protein [Pirellulaceae bacterium]